MADVENITVADDNVEMRGIALGAGPPIVLVHGFASSYQIWVANLNALAKRYRVLAVDLPGFGSSTKVALQRLDDFGDFLGRLLDSQRLDSAHLVGHSFGGLVVLGFALRHPGRVRSLTLVDPAGLGPTSTDFRKRIALARTAQEIKEAISTVVYDKARFDQMIDTVVAGQVAYRAEPGVLELLAALNEKAEAWISTVERRVDEVRAPMLVLWGKEDRCTPASNADRVRGLPNVQVHYFERAGHAPNLEVADAFNVRLMSFLDAQPAP